MRVPLRSIHERLLCHYRRFQPRPLFFTCYNLNNCTVFNSNAYFRSQLFSNMKSNLNRNSKIYCTESSSNSGKTSVSEKEQNRIWTIPNMLCCARIVASPVLCYYILKSDYDLALGLLLIAGFTDFADGQIARRFPNQTSKIGSFLDPLADKILVISLYSALTYTEAVPVALTALIVLRDVLLLGAGSYIRYLSLPSPKNWKHFFDGSQSSAKLKPTYLSKINTAIQIITAAVSLYAPNISSLPHSALVILWSVAGCTTILSGLQYAILGKKTYTISRKR